MALAGMCSRLVCGATMRAAAMASTNSRSRQGLEASNEIERQNKHLVSAP